MDGPQKVFNCASRAPHLAPGINRARFTFVGNGLPWLQISFSPALLGNGIFQNASTGNILLQFSIGRARTGGTCGEPTNIFCWCYTDAIKDRKRIAQEIRCKMGIEIRRSRTYVIYHKRLLCVCIAIRRNIGMFAKCLLEKRLRVIKSHVKKKGKKNKKKYLTFWKICVWIANIRHTNGLRSIAY